MSYTIEKFILLEGNMNLFGKKTIRKKIIGIILLICFLVISFGFTVVIVRYIADIKLDMINSVTIDARLIGEYCTTALIFNYPDRAEEILNKLKSLSIVIYGIVYDNMDQQFATYSKCESKANPPKLHKETSYEYIGDYLHVWEPIIYQEKRYGTMYLCADTQLHAKIYDHIIVMTGLIVCMLLLTYILARNFQKVISLPISYLSQTTKIITEQGDYSIRIVRKTNDEIGELYQAFNNMLEVIEKRTIEIERENWVKNGQAQLSEKLRGDQTLESMGDNIIVFIAEYLDAQLATLYLSDENKTLKLLSTYAIHHKDTIPTLLQYGEGLIGQAALNQKVIHIKQCPDNYIHISSSLGNVVPNQILIYPLIREHHVKAVIELASLHSFDEQKIFFLNQISDNITIAIYSMVSRNQLADLLMQTQDQASELRVREEELSQTNEEFAENNRILENQKIEIEMKNNELLIAQKIVEEKMHELEITNKYKSEFLANMSHELRTPLNSILLLSRVLFENSDDHLTQDDIESAKTIHSSGTELLNLINDILDLSKIEAGQIVIHVEKTIIHQLADNMKKTFTPLALDRGLEFIIDVSQNIPTAIYTDKQRIEQIVKNFLANAFKFTYKGRVTLNIERPSLSKEISIMLNQNGLDASQTVAFSVIDSGIGISEEKQKIIFEAFQQADGTTSRKYGGTGLGLSISREFSKLLGGIIRVNSEPNAGSTFTLYLPIKKKSFDKKMIIKADLEQADDIPSFESKNEPLKTSDEPSFDLIHKSEAKNETIPVNDKIIVIKDDRERITPEDKTILIIEDDPFFAEHLMIQSQNNGFKTLVADNGKLGIQLAELYIPKAIILDIKLPGINGWKVIEKLKENPLTRHIPINCISASEDSGLAKKMGVMAYLIKPINQDELDKVYNNLNMIISKQVKDLLIIEDENFESEAIIKLIGNSDVKISVAHTGQEGIELLESQNIDCIILDLGLPDISGFELLRLIRQEKNIDYYQIPIIIYTAKELTKDEMNIAEEFAQITIIKGEKSLQRLLDETTLFLHRVDADLPEKQKQIMSMLHDKDRILSGKTILIVDDDMRNVFSLKKILTEKNIHVIVGKNGIEGIEQLQQNPDIQLVLMDIMMPEMDGYEAIQKIRENTKFKRLPIIALTAKAMKGDREKCIQAGANDYISKPIDVESLFSMLTMWLF